jgi:hypothetical protein
MAASKVSLVSFFKNFTIRDVQVDGAASLYVLFGAVDPACTAVSSDNFVYFPVCDMYALVHHLLAYSLFLRLIIPETAMVQASSCVFFLFSLAALH